ncbi:MAG: DMT family transporter [Candidatus Binatia bacterium]
MQAAAFFALCGAVFLALRDIIGRLAIRGIDPVLGTAATTLLGLPILALISALGGDFRHPWPGWDQPLVNIGLAGILRITVARTLLFSAINRAGAVRASSLASTNVFFAMLLGPVFLEETLTFSLALGATLVVAGCVLMARSRAKATTSETDRRYIVGVSLALMSALAFGSSAAFARSAIGSFASPIQANFYANTVALLSYLPLLWGKPLRREVKTWPAQTWTLIALVGLVVSLGTTSAYFALARAPVVFVQPISQSRPLFVIAISWLFFQVHEKVNWHVAVGAASIVGGTILLILSL